MRNLCAIASLLSVVAATPAVSAQSSRPVPERPEQYRDPVANYLRVKARDFAESAAGARALGATTNVTAIYNLLKGKRAFSDDAVRGKDDAQRGQVRDALTQTVAYHLVSVGMTPPEINRLSRAGYDPLASGTRAISGRANLEDVLVLSEIPLVVEVTESEVKDTPEALVRDVRFSVVKNIKKAKGITETAAVLVPFSASANELQPGTRCIFFLSRSLAQFRRAAGKPMTGSELQQQESPFCLLSGAYRRLSSSPVQSNISIEEAEQAISRLAAAY